jgi:L-serine dehydratase
MKTYHSVKELFALAEENHCSPGVIACRLESEESGKDFDEVWEKMKKTIPVFRQSIQRGLADTKKSASGLVGGDANAIFMVSLELRTKICISTSPSEVRTIERLDDVSTTSGASGIIRYTPL